MSIFLASDCDGVFTFPGKFYYEDHGELKVYKRFSDRDSIAIQFLQDNKVEIVIVSGDKRVNELWCKHKKIQFEYCPYHKSKLALLQKKYAKQIQGQWVYIGDSIVDAECLNVSTLAYYPHDVSLMLLSVVKKSAIRAPIDGGCGVLEWVTLDLIKRELLPNTWKF